MLCFFFFYLPPSSSICHSGKLALFRKSVFSFICSSLAISLCVSSLPACFPLFILFLIWTFTPVFFFFFYSPPHPNKCFFFQTAFGNVLKYIRRRVWLFYKWSKVLFSHFFRVLIFGVNYAETFSWHIAKIQHSWVSHDHNPNLILSL